MLTQEEALKLIRYDDGKLFWRKRDVNSFSTVRSGRAWNAKYAEKEITALSNHGYIRFTFKKKRYLAHRIIWLMMYGNWPKDQIDHANHNRLDNRIENLNESTQAENCKNISLYSKNTSGFCGVHWCKNRLKWISQGSINGKFKHLGRFSNKQDAIEARKKFNFENNFHENHGRR